MALEVNQKKEEKKSPPAAPVPTESLAVRAKRLGLPLLSEKPKEINRRVLGLIPEETARKYKMAAYEEKGHTARVAMADPEDFEALNVLRFLAEKERVEIEVTLAPLDVINEIFRGYATTDRALKEAILSLKKGEEELASMKQEKPDSRKAEVFQDAPIAKLVSGIVTHAMEGRASDIHIEPVDQSYRVRFRIDGLLRSQLIFPLDVGRAVISRIKILSNLKIDEKRKPQDGRFRFEHDKGSIDLRVSSLPVMEGEKIVMRVLDRAGNISDLERLGLWGGD